MNNKVTHLTKDAIKNLNHLKAAALPLIVQALSYEESEMIEKQGNPLLFLTINDGYCKKLLALKDDFPALINSLKQNNFPIIKINKGVINPSMQIITSLELIDDHYKQIIGDPIDEEIYDQQNCQNPKGSNEIIYSKAQIKISIKNSSTQQTIKEEHVDQNQQQKQNNSSIKQNQKISITTKVKKPVELIQDQQQTQQKQQQNQQQEQQQQYLTFQSISELSPMMPSFRLKGRVLSKSDKTNFKNNNGQFFKIEIMDREKMTIQGIFFKEACDKFFDLIQVGKIYSFENGTVKTNKFSSKQQLVSDNQITFEMFSKIRELSDDKEIENQNFNCITIKQIEELNIDSKCDVIGVIGDMKTNQIKIQQESKQKTTLVLFDEEGDGIEVTLWGNQAEKFQLKSGLIAAFKGLKISEYQAKRQLSSTQSTFCEIDQDKLQQIDKYEIIKRFREENQDQINQQQKISQAKSRMKITSISEIESEFKGKMDTKFQKFYEIRGLLCPIYNKSFTYESCQSCHKKVSQQGQNQYYCNGCNSYQEKPEYRYVYQAKVIDQSGQLFVQTTANTGQIILNKSANDYEKLSSGEKELLLKRCSYQFKRMVIIGKIEEYQGNIRPRYTLTNLVDTDYLAEAKEVFSNIEALQKQLNQ